MFNLLIAIISKTFEDFDDEKDLKDIQELFEIFVELSAFVRFFSGIAFFKRKSESYLHVISYDQEGKN